MRDAAAWRQDINILSIQSWVVFGHVGNASAVFPLQRLGAEVWAINTVQFSNHPGYGGFTGAATPPGTLEALVAGVAARGALAECAALLSGYVGDPHGADVILQAALRLRASNRAALWCCDPVIGDDDPGIYVQDGVADFFRVRAVPQADLLTPNQFELGCLTDMPCATLDQTMRAMRVLRARMRADGPRIVLVTSLRCAETAADRIDLLVASAAGIQRLQLPRLEIAPNGAGDVIAGLFLYHILRGTQAGLAMAQAASAVHGVLRATLQAGARELRLIAAQEEFVNPSIMFCAEAC